MDMAEAKKHLARVREYREQFVGEMLKQEEEWWNKEYENDKFFLEKKMIRYVCDEFQDINTLGCGIDRKLLLENTRFSGTDFINMEQFTEIMTRAGIEVTFKREWPEKGTHANVTVEMDSIISQGYEMTSIDTSDEELERLFNEGEQDWLMVLFGAYNNYRLSPEGKASTEAALAAGCFDNLTNSWHLKQREGEIKVAVPHAQSNYVTPKDAFNEKYVNYRSMLDLLESMLDQAGFELEIIHNSLYKRWESISLQLKEKDYILNEEGLPKVKMIKNRT